MEISVDTVIGGYLIGLASATNGALDGLGVALILDELMTGAPSATVVKRLTEMGRHVREKRTAQDESAV